MRRALLALLVVLPLVVAGAPPAIATDDPFLADQWSLAQIGAPAAWSVSTGRGVTIGIVDTGVDGGHPDLRDKIDGYADCVGGPCREGFGRDGQGHGTLVAGIAAAATGNGRGIAGVAPDARLVVARAVDDQGRGTIEDIEHAIRWVVDRGASIVNLSLGDPNFLLVSLLGTPLRPSIQYAWSRGAIPVLASGNENVGVLELGSSNYGHLDAVVVGASDASGAVAAYSSPVGNAKWGLVAPGGSGSGPPSDILSTYPGGRYAWTAGTSMAAPHVSGALALLLAQGLSREAAIQRLLANVDTARPCGVGCRGRLDLRAVLAGPVVTAGVGAPRPVAPPPTAAPTAATTPSTARPPATAGSTTTVPAPATTGPGLERPSPTVELDDRQLAAAPLDGRPDRPDPDLGTPAVAAAIALLVIVTGGLGAATVRRLTGVARW